MRRSRLRGPRRPGIGSAINVVRGRPTGRRSLAGLRGRQGYLVSLTSRSVRCHVQSLRAARRTPVATLHAQRDGPRWPLSRIIDGEQEMGGAGGRRGVAGDRRRGDVHQDECAGMRRGQRAGVVQCRWFASDKGRPGPQGPASQSHCEHSSVFLVLCASGLRRPLLKLFFRQSLSALSKYPKIFPVFRSFCTAFVCVCACVLYVCITAPPPPAPSIALCSIASSLDNNMTFCHAPCPWCSACVLRAGHGLTHTHALCGWSELLPWSNSWMTPPCIAPSAHAVEQHTWQPGLLVHSRVLRLRLQ